MTAIDEDEKLTRTRVLHEDPLADDAAQDKRAIAEAVYAKLLACRGVQNYKDMYGKMLFLARERELAVADGRA